MYTQCPDCATAFRVTAEILKQAGGKVRCGGCGVAFNALAYLSETKPGAPPPTKEDEALPELTPDPVEHDDGTPPPRAISPEQSAALLKTLDELAGSDIRLEDTGVEWRLLDDEDEDGDDDPLQLPDDMDTPVDAELSGDTGNTSVDELLDDTPAGIDEILTTAPSEVEAGEVFDDAAAEVDSPEVFSGDADAHVVDEDLGDSDDEVEPVAEFGDDELRFDDNTGLPEDDDGDAPVVAPVVAFEQDAETEPEPEFIEPAAHTETQVDIVFGEPDEWGELLDEVDVDADDDEQALEVRGEIIEPEAADDDDDASSLTIEDELDALDDELLEAEPAEEDAAVEEPPDTAAPSDAQAGAPGASLRRDGDDEDPFPDSTDDLESELARAQDLSDRILSVLSRHGVEDVDELDAKDGDDAEIENLSLDLDEAEAATEADALAGLELAGDEVDDSSHDEFDLSGDLDVSHDPEPDTELEDDRTTGEMIDQDLPEPSLEVEDRASRDDEPEIDIPGFPSMSSGVETIIMEGEFVRTALEQEALEAEAAREQKPEENAFIAAAKKTFRGTISRRDDDEPQKPTRNFRTAAGLALLGLLLAGQLVHQSRAALATIPAVNSVIAPIYRMIGSPITPRWDVTGWKFEVTRETLSGSEPLPTGGDPGPDGTTTGVGAADAAAEPAPEILTIYSRLGNSGDSPLPYPLITVSLTDRYEETIGSTVLDPTDYLAAQTDSSQLISPGNTFEAIIPIESPSGEATGYKLNVCYRQARGDLRCAVEDFK